MTEIGACIGMSVAIWVYTVLLRKQVVYHYEGVEVLSPTRKGKSYSEQTRDLFNILPTKLNSLLSPLL